MAEGSVLEFIRESGFRHAADQEIDCGIGAVEALELTEEALGRILPLGVATPGHEFFWIVRDGVRVGDLWLSWVEYDGALFIYDLFLDEAERGKGYGSAALRAVEDLAREAGLSMVRLDVFNHNVRARELYERLGYGMDGVGMVKKIA